MLFGVIGLVLGLAIYGYMLVCCQEDERKHHLTLCSPSGDACLGAGGKFVEQEPVEEGLEAIPKFLAWIASAQWFFPQEVPTDDPTTSNDVIIVHNRTLKQIKVCFYASDDLCCWVPFGGVSGRCVGFIQAEQCRAFRPPRCSEIKGGFRLKVFQPGLFDKELACYPKAHPGQSFAFHDVEKMVKRARGLSSSPSSKKSADIQTVSSWCAESSESEVEHVVARSLCPSEASPSSGGSKDFGLGGMKRCRSGGDLQSRLEPTKNAGSPAKSESLRPEARRAAPNEVVVRNRSNQEIRALLFRSNDYCCMVPLVGHLLACGDSILPEMERRFNPKASEDKEFTVKVYSVGPGAKELTYLTVERGQTYIFWDSVLS
jgi:hypothetical protein